MPKEFTGIKTEAARKLAQATGFVGWRKLTEEERVLPLHRSTKAIAEPYCDESKIDDYWAACDAAGIPEDDRGYWVYSFDPPMMGGKLE